MSKAAVQIAQSMLNAAGNTVLREDGRIGERTLRAYDSVSDDIRVLIDESTMRWEKVKFSDLVNSYRLNADGVRATPVKTRTVRAVQLGPRALATPVIKREVAPPVTAVPPRMSGARLERHLRSTLESMGYSADGIRGIISQIQLESSMGAILREMMHRTRAQAVRAKIAAFRLISDAEFAKLKTREQYFEAAYGAHTKKGSGKGGLGNTKPGDGGKYYGRGIIQETGRWNYQRISDLSGLDFINHPDKLASDWEWTWRGLMASIEARFGSRRKSLTTAQVRANVNPGLV